MLICLNDLFACLGLAQTRKLLTNFSKNSFYLLPEPLRLGEFLTNYCKKGTICYKEYFKVLFLNQANQILGYTLISEGGITETCADVRLIMQAALLTNSVALILAHNHPSGNLKPSPEDIRLTKQVREASNFMRIKILDHIILSDTEYYSFADEGML